MSVESGAPSRYQTDKATRSERLTVSFDLEGVADSRGHSICSDGSGAAHKYAPDAVAEDARSSNLSFHYSGRHDHGDLPSLRADSAGVALVSAIQEAKAECGAYLTQLINVEAAAASASASVSVSVSDSKGGDGKPAEKRARMEAC